MPRASSSASGGGRVALVLCLLALAWPAHAVERLVPAKRLMPWFDYYLGMAEARRDRFRPAYQVLVDDRPYTGAVVLVDGARRTPLAMGPDGRFDQFPTLAELKRRPLLALDAPAHARIKADLGVEALAPHGVEIATAPLRQAIDQLNTALKGAAGVLSFAVPRFGRAFFIFGGRAGAAVAADGSALPLPLGEDAPVEPFWSPSRQPSAVAVRFPAAPARVMLAPGS